MSVYHHGPRNLSLAVLAGAGLILTSGFARGELLKLPAREPTALAVDEQSTVRGLRPGSDVPAQYYLIGQGIVEGGAAGGEIEGYRNTDGPFYYPAGANTRTADDIRIACLSQANMTRLEILVDGGGNGSGPGFSVQFEMFTACPSDPGSPGVPIPGTQGSANLPNDGPFVVALDTSAAPIPLQARSWVAVTLSTAAAGWKVGAETTIGSSADIFDGPFPCTSHFGGCGVACANFGVRVLVDQCDTVSHLAYRTNSQSGFFFGMFPVVDQFADDVRTIDSPESCSVTRYQPGLAGVNGPFRMQTEVWSNSDANKPEAPVLGTFCETHAQGDGSLEIGECIVQPAAFVPTPLMWVVYQIPATSTSGGPILTADEAEVGTGVDCFSIFDDPDVDPDAWSACQWFFGGCPGPPEDPNPCGTFYNTVYCLGTEPVGACCDILTPGSDNCTADAVISQCAGRFSIGTDCGTATFDPPCGTGSCCKPDTTCENLSADACRAANGLWRPSVSCDDPDFSCPNGACLSASGPCLTAHEDSPGCVDLGCCGVVCDIDSFCCDVGWDDTCISLATDLCVLSPPVNDNCVNAVALGEGTVLVNSLSATPDGPALPASCNDGQGIAIASDVWFKYTPEQNGTVTLDLCSDTDLNTRVAVYNSCTCPVTLAQTTACDDDGCGATNGPSRIEFPATGGNCYLIRVGGAPGPNATGIGTMTVSFTGTGPTCPTGLMFFTNPSSGSIDARQPNPVNNLNPPQGLQTFQVSGPLGAEDPSCWSMCETAQRGGPNSIQSVVDEASGVYTITLSRPITPGAVTRLAYTPDTGLGTIATFYFHPGNVNGDSSASPVDILRIIDCLNGVNPDGNCPFGLLSRDIDRSGQFNPADVLRVIDLLNGADVFDPWNGTALPSATCTP